MCLAANPTLPSATLTLLTTMNPSAALQNWLKPNNQQGQGQGEDSGDN